MFLINSKVNRTISWSSTCVITNSTGAGTFAGTLCSGYNFTNSRYNKNASKIKPCFKRTINGEKYQLKVSIERKKHYLGY